MKWLYGIFWRDASTQHDLWVMTTNKRQAIKHSKSHPGSDVYRVSYGHSRVWDAPTFKVVGDRIFTTRTNVLSTT